MLTLAATVFSSVINGVICALLAFAYPGGGAPPSQRGCAARYAVSFRREYDAGRNHLRWLDYTVSGVAFAFVRYTLVRQTDPAVLFMVAMSYVFVYVFYYARELTGEKRWILGSVLAWFGQQIPLLVIFPVGDPTAIVLVIAALLVFLTNAAMHATASRPDKDLKYLALNGVYRIVLAWVSFFSQIDYSV